MKTLRLALSIIILAIFTSITGLGQRIIHTELVMTADDYLVEGWGILNGTVTYLLTIQLSKETGMIQKIHANIQHCDITNENGEKLRTIDSATDTYGTSWDFWNRPNYYNAEEWGAPEITFNVEDDWLDDLGILPNETPDEGTMVGMAFKWIYNGHPLHLGALIQLHRNAHGDITAEVYKLF